MTARNAGELWTSSRSNCERLRVPRCASRAGSWRTLELGDVVAVRRGEGRIFFAVVDFHVDKGGRAAIVKLLPFRDNLPIDPTAAREAAASATRDELFGEGSPFFIVFNGGRAPGRLPSHVEVVAHGLVDSPSGLTGGTVTWWRQLAETAEPALRQMGLD